MQTLLGNFTQGLRVQTRCIHALVIRDMMMRYGRGNIGFLWVVVEPLILTSGVMGIWSIVKPSYEHGVHVIEFVLTGYMPLTLWRHMMGSSIHIFKRNSGLLYHRNLSLIDTFLSQMFLEFAGTTAALGVITSVLVAAGVINAPRDPGLLIFGWLLKGIFSFGIALNVAVLTAYSDVSERFIGPYQYFMLPLSGTFFMVEWLPPAAQNLIWYNPDVHCFEMFRAGFFGEDVTTHYSAWYTLVWSLALIALGLWGIEKVRERVN